MVVVCSYAQLEQITIAEVDSVTICWEAPDNMPENSEYILSYSVEGTSVWRKITQTPQTQCRIAVPAYGSVNFGVCVVTDNIKTDMHTCQDSTACVDDKCGETCTSFKPWIAHFVYRKPYGIRIILD